MDVSRVNQGSMPWWSSRLSALDFRVMLVIEGYGPISTGDILDHWLLYPYQSEGSVRKSLAKLRDDALIVGERDGSRDQFLYYLGVPGLGFVRPGLET